MNYLLDTNALIFSLSNPQGFSKRALDRLIIAQAQVRDFTIVTKDGTIPQYDVKTVW